VRDPDRIIEAVRPELEELEARRRDLLARRAAALKRIAGVAGGIAGVGAPVAYLIGGSPLWVAPLVAAVVVALVMLVVTVLRPASRFKEELKRALVGRIVRAMEPGMTFAPERGVPEADFVRSRLFPTRPDRYRYEDSLEGTIGKTRVRLSEVHAEERRVSHDSKGRTRTRWVTIFRGVFMVAGFHKHFRGTTRVLPDTAERLLGGLGKVLQDFRPFSKEDLVYLEDPEFEKEFVVYGSDQIEARYVLSTAMLRRILDLKRVWKSEVRLSFVDDRVFVAIAQRRDLFEPRLGRAVASREQLAPLIAELTLCLDVVDDLNLNTRIWTRA